MLLNHNLYYPEQDLNLGQLAGLNYLTDGLDHSATTAGYFWGLCSLLENPKLLDPPKIFLRTPMS